MGRKIKSPVFAIAVPGFYFMVEKFFPFYPKKFLFEKEAHSDPSLVHLFFLNKLKRNPLSQGARK